MAAHARPRRSPLLLAALAADAAYEFAIGAALLVWSGDFARWFQVSEVAAVVLGTGFVLAGFALVALLFVRAPARVVSALATANVAGGALGWLLFAAFFRVLEGEGRWLLAAASDGCVAFGLIERLLLHRDQGSVELGRR